MIYWTWNELPIMPSESLSPPKPSTASAPKLMGQEPTVEGADKTLPEVATAGNSTARIFESTSDPSIPSFLSTTSSSSSTSTNTTISTASTPPTSGSLSPSQSGHLDVKPPSLALLLLRLTLLAGKIPKSPFFGKKLGATPRIFRVPSVSGVLDLGVPTFEGPVNIKSAGSTMVGGSDKELDGHTGDEGSALSGFEAFGGENGGPPFLEILADLRTLHHHKPCKPNQPQYVLAAFFFS